MAPARLSVLAAALPLLAPLARGKAAACLQDGVEYAGEQLIAPGYVLTPEQCQEQCRASLYCEFFTWRADGNESLNMGKNSCQKYGVDAVPQAVANATPGAVVSGRANCATTTPSGSTAAELPTPAALPTLDPVPTSESANRSAVATLVAKDETSGGGGLPFWAIWVIVLGVVGLLLAVAFFACSGGSGGKKKSKRSKRITRDDAEEGLAQPMAAATECEPLAPAEVPRPEAEQPQAVFTRQAQGGDMQQPQLPATQQQPQLLATWQAMGGQTPALGPQYVQQRQSVQMSAMGQQYLVR